MTHGELDMEVECLETSRAHKLAVMSALGQERYLGKQGGLGLSDCVLSYACPESHMKLRVA